MFVINKLSEHIYSVMITCHKKYLEARCAERGHSISEVMSCVLAQDGEMWTVDVNHPSYPLEKVAALSFTCVPDCNTPEFACAPNKCCVDLPNGGTDCVSCQSSSSSEQPTPTPTPTPEPSSSASGSSSTSQSCTNSNSCPSGQYCCNGFCKPDSEVCMCWSCEPNGVCIEGFKNPSPNNYTCEDVGGYSSPESCNQDCSGGVGCCCTPQGPAFWIDGAQSCVELTGGTFFPGDCSAADCSV